MCVMSMCRVYVLCVCAYHLSALNNEAFAKRKKPTTVTLVMMMVLLEERCQQPHGCAEQEYDAHAVEHGPV